MSVGTHSRSPQPNIHRKNPKRVPRADSVCIRKSASSNSARSARAGSDDLSVASNIAANGEDPSFYDPNSHITKAGESARTWFDDSNKNVTGDNGAKFYGGMLSAAILGTLPTPPDDDPPFFLRNKSSSDDSPAKQGLRPSTVSNAVYHGLPPGSSMSRNPVMESSSEDFRSVIDDLTIENRRLRKKLQKYEQLHCDDLQHDKLFEIRVHGLPASKKRKLERTLQDFASSLGDTGDDELPAFAQKLSRGLNPGLPPVPQASSSSTVNSRPVDSAYVSMSTPGGTSDPRLQKVDSGRPSGPTPSNDQNVHSYLQTISQRLLPKHPSVMNEQIKRQLVVKRLEQLFTGSRDTSNKHSQSRQQQEVSQSAAKADRRESEAQGQYIKAEGTREAKIHRSDAHAAQGLAGVETSLDDASSRDPSTSSGLTPDQRPTRPLDLDPSRAQNPEENMEYMKHLGFHLPDAEPETRLSHTEGWVYLNLLTSMAQLHTLNVTPDFVRNSVRDISAKFELSADGGRIRWKGGHEGTKLAIDSGGSSEHSSEAYPSELGASRDSRQSRSSKPPTEIPSGISGNAQSSNHPSSGSYNTNFDRQRPLLLGQTSSEDPYQYRPIFYHAVDEKEESYSFDGRDSPLSPLPMDSTSALNPDGAHHGYVTKSAAKSRIRNGVDPIIFYNRARFYTDLSKDDESMPYNCPLYTKASEGIVGCENITGQEAGRAEGKGIMSHSQGQSPLASLENSASNLSLAGFTDGPANTTRSWSGESEVKSLEVSGLGGVVPGDNFSIRVDVEFDKPSRQSAVKSKVVSSHRTELLPSALPPPSYAFLPLSSGSAGNEDDSGEEEESDEGSDEDVEDGEEDAVHFVRPKFLNAFSPGFSHDDTTNDDQESDDSSIDLLAHARQIEPEEVAAREREFEENIARDDEDEEEMEVDPPASSVVATVGEQSNMDEGTDVTKEHRKSRSIGRKRPAVGGPGHGKTKQRRVASGA